MTEEELIAFVTKKGRLSMIYQQKLQEAEEKNRTDLQKLVDLVNGIFSRYGLPDVIDISHIRFQPDYVGNITHVKDKKLSTVILNNIFPTPKRKLFAHYTSFDAGLNIIKTKELRLFNLINNFDDEEFKLFYEDHEIDGYQIEREVFGVTTGYKRLMSTLFAFCMTTDDNTSPSLWQYFGDNGTGLKLTFEVIANNPDFREVYYSNSHASKQIPLLKDLFHEIKTRFAVPLNFTYMSKMGGFYIKGHFDNEKEFRFLLKKDTEEYGSSHLSPIAYLGDVTYINVPFISEFATFKLVKVEKGPGRGEADFQPHIPSIKKDHPTVNIIA